MPYVARTDDLPELALSGGIVDPRATQQPSFGKRMSCRDATDFVANAATFSPLVLKGRKTVLAVPSGAARATLDIAGPHEKNGTSRLQQQALADLVPGLVVCGGRSRSPAFDCLPVISHWADRTDETAAPDSAATVSLTSTWTPTHVIGEGATMASPDGAFCWTLKTHGIAPALTGASKFSQQYNPETDTLTTTVNLARRTDTARTGGVIAEAASISWMRNARVADAVDCAVGLLSDASALLEARDRVIASGMPQRLPFAEVREVAMPSWVSARKPLPPKMSGVAYSPDKATEDLLASERCEGPLLNTSIFSMAVGYNRGVYGGSVSGLWALMDSAFVVDYSVGAHDSAMAHSLSAAFAEVASVGDAAPAAGPHITDIRIVKGCNYGCLRQKTTIEDAHPVPSRPCIVVWDDLARLARYKLADAVFCHVYCDAGGGEAMAAIAGLGCVAHDWLDLGADVACGEVSNIIPSLTRGSLAEAPLAEVYSRLLGAMLWYRAHDPYNPAALCLLFTHWWQLANCRHRPIALLGRTDLTPRDAIAATVPAARPGLAHFQAQGTKVERGGHAVASAEARLAAVIAAGPLPETKAVIELLVAPVLAYVKGGDTLPAESEYVGAVLAAELAYPHDRKILELWDLAIVMWECGSMWAAGVAGLCYTHTGRSNCDRAREDLADGTWS